MHSLVVIFRYIIRILSLFVFGLVSFSNNAIAQDSKFSFSYLSDIDGLSQNTVLSITQDSKGFMWFGTGTGGLNKYDGYSFTHYKLNFDDPFSISDIKILQVYEDSKQRLWVGTHRGGLNRYSHATNDFCQYSVSHNKSVPFFNSSILSIVEDENNVVWFGSNEGLFYYNATVDSVMKFKIIGRSTRTVTALCRAGNNLLWVGTHHGLFLLNTTTNTFVKSFISDSENTYSLSGNIISVLLLDSKNRLWAGTRNNGLNCLVDTAVNVFRKYRHESKNKNSLLNNYVRTLSEDKQGAIWIGTGQGIDILHSDEQVKKSPTFTHIQRDKKVKASLGQNSVFSLYIDNKSDIWIGSWSKGISYLNNRTHAFQNHEQDMFGSTGLTEYKVTAITVHDSNICVGTHGGGVNVFNQKLNKNTRYLHKKNNPNSLSSNNVISLYSNPDSSLWIGTQAGLSILDKDTNFRFFLKGEKIHSIIADINGDIWVGTNNGLYRYIKNKKQFRYYKSDKNDVNSLSFKTINVIYLDEKQNIWVGTEIGLNRYNRAADNFEQYNFNRYDSSTIRNHYVNSICNDKNGNLWIGTYDGLSLYLPETNSFSRYGKNEGFPYSDVENLVAGDKGDLWLTISNGIVQFIPNVKDKRKSIIKFFDKSEGIQRGAFTRNTSLRTNSGELYFGGSNGFYHFHPDSIVEDTSMPKVAIIGFKLFNKEVTRNDENSVLSTHITTTKEITLNHKQSVLSFSFVAFNYESPEKNQYAYIMEGFDKDWNYIGNKTEATYTNLPSGKYTFRVKASYNKGYWSDANTSIKLTILPAWWYTWWFISLSIALLITSVYSAYVYRIRLLKRQQIKLEHKVQERTNELQAASVELEENHEEILNQKEELQRSISHLQSAQSLLIQSEKMASIGVLASGVAHEINNPLNYILGGKTMLEDYFMENSGAYSDDVKSWIEMIDIGVDRASGIVKSLNRFSRNTNNYNENCDLHLVIDNCLTIMQSQTEDRVNFIKNFTNKNFILKGNEGEIHQVLINVLTNGLQSISDKGTITIATEIIDTNLELTISDTGSGISKENLNIITEPFFTTKYPGEGTGLGMSIAYTIIESHKGNIKFESELGSGTRVIITIPIQIPNLPLN